MLSFAEITVLDSVYNKKKDFVSVEFDYYFKSEMKIFIFHECRNRHICISSVYLDKKSDTIKSSLKRNEHY